MKKPHTRKNRDVGFDLVLKTAEKSQEKKFFTLSVQDSLLGE